MSARDARPCRESLTPVQGSSYERTHVRPELVSVHATPHCQTGPLRWTPSAGPLHAIHRRGVDGSSLAVGGRVMVGGAVILAAMVGGVR
jgi:hypothetical protein